MWHQGRPHGTRYNCLLEVTAFNCNDLYMAATSDTPRQRLGGLVALRRKELALSMRAAADAAGIGRPTWTALEQASRETEAYIYARVERVLGWKLGSIEVVLAGGQPLVETDPERHANHRGRRSSDDLIRDIWADPELDIDQKERYVQLVTRAEAERNAAEANIRAVEERLREGRERRGA